MAPSHAVMLASEGGRTLLYGIGNFSAANFYQTAVGGGEPGVASGFGVATLLRLLRVPTATNAAGGYGTLSYVSWYHPYVAAGGALQSYIMNGAGTLIASKSRQFTASDVGRLFLTLMLHDGSFLRHYVDRAELPGAPACAGLTQYAGAQHEIGGVANHAQFGGDLEVISQVAFRGVPSAAQIEAFFDAARALGELPNAMQGATISHRWPDRSALRALAGQTAPATLTDTITRAAADALARQGSPTVVTIDTSRDGRRMLGVQGWSPSNLYQTNGGIRGSSTSGLWVGFYGRLDALAAGMALFRYATSGWYLQQSAATTFRFVIFDAGGAFTASPNFTVSSADLAQPMAILAQYTGAGGALRLYAKRVQQGADVTGAITLGVPTTPMQVGFYTAQPYASTIAGIVGANRGDLTLAEIQEWFDAIERTGRIAQIAGKTSAADGGHLYDFTRDILDAGGAVPAQILDRIGTDHLTRVGGLRVTTTPANGIADFSASHWIQSAGVTLPGSASGFYAEALGYYVAGASAEDWFSCAAFAATAGWRLGSWNGYANVQAGDGAAAKGAVGSALMSPGLNHLALVYDGSVLKQFLNGTLYNTTTTFTYAVSTLAATFGINRPSAPANITTKSGLLGGAYGLLAPSDAQIAAAASAALSAGRIVGVPGHSQRYDLVQDVIDAGGKVPAIWRERVANTNTMTTVGAPLQVAQRTERVWSYETSPIYYGASGFGAGDQYAYANGFVGDAAGFWALLWYVITSQSVPSATRILLGCGGWDIRTSLANSTIGLGFMDGASSYTIVGTTAITAADVGKVQCFGFCWDGPAQQVRPFSKRTALAATARSGYTAAPGALAFGRVLSWPADAGISLLGFAVGFGSPANAEFLAAYDAGMAQERVAGIAERSSTLVDLTLDAKGNGGVLPAVLADRAGGGRALTRAGNVTTTPHYARAYGW